MKKINLEIMRHSCSHLLAVAVLKLWPETKLGIGPAIEDGFYYDFDFAKPINEADLEKITAAMSQVIEEKLPFKKRVISVAEAKNIFRNQPYKLELAALKEVTPVQGLPLTVYETGDFIDLCAGPHVKDTSGVGFFKLLSLAGAYWRGNEKNKMLTRIYGTCFSTQNELDHYLWQQEEAKKRDHRLIGKNLNLFVFSDLVGKGLPMFTEKGSIIRRELEKFIVDEEIKRGYHHVYTPDLANVALFKKSGHYPYYKDTMYPVMKIDDEELILKPMTCPHHFQLYLSQQRSYKDLPIRFAELAKQFRYEKSGELTGLIRVRAFCLADAHIICRKDQAVSEINSVLDLIEYSAGVLGLAKNTDYRYRLSLGDRKDDKKFYKDDSAWDFAENILRGVLRARKSPYFEAEGEAAFYGPKIDIQIRNFAGIENTAFTVQYDFVMPKRFELTYTGKDGSKKEAIVIHRSSIGCLERVIAFLIEKYAGAFPVWLAPVQVVVIPIADRNIKYGQGVQKQLKEAEIRVELDERQETTSAKIRDAQLQKIPYMLIVGDREEENKTVSLRCRSGKDCGQIKLDRFIKNLKKEIAEKSLI
jgi:threonyl-tRNA synthetase